MKHLKNSQEHSMSLEEEYKKYKLDNPENSHFTFTDWLRLQREEVAKEIERWNRHDMGWLANQELENEETEDDVALLAPSIRKVIEDSYNDYISVDDERTREIMARHITRAAQGFINNFQSKLEDWLEIFKDEDIVISKLKELKK